MSVTINASTSAGLIQTADTSGTVEIQSNGSTKLTIASTGAYGQLIQGTAQTASGSSVDFTGIPSWVKRITVQIIRVGFAAAGASSIRIGSGSLATTGYLANSFYVDTTPAAVTATSTTGFIGFNASAGSGTTVMTGQAVLTNYGSNNWVITGSIQRIGDGGIQNQYGNISLSGALDRISLVATTSTFNTGTINILYEG